MKLFKNLTQKTAIALLIAGAVFCVSPTKASACDLWCNFGAGLGLSASVGLDAGLGIGISPYANFGVSGGYGNGYGGGYNYTQYPNLQYVYNQPTQSQPSQYNYVQYPYLTYQYTQAAKPKADAFNYVQYPTLTYRYNQNPAPKDPLAEFYNSYAQYPTMAYVYNGQNPADVQAKYSQYSAYSTPIQTPTQQMYGNSAYGYGNSNSGFTMTSGY